MTAFDFGAKAELFSNRTKSELLAERPRTRRREPVGYGRFARASDAIRFAIEELTPGPPPRHLPRSRGGEVRRQRDTAVVRQRKISAGTTGHGPVSIQSPSLEIPLRGGKLLLRSFVRRALRRAPSASPWDNREPIREELFSVERLEEHARSLAIAQAVTSKPTRGHPLAGRLADNGAVLLDAYRRIARGDRRRARDHAGGGMADRQLSSRRTANSRNPLRSAARLLPAAAEAGRRTVRRISARVRSGLGFRRPHRQPLRPRDAVPLRARLPGGPAADDRRTLGGRDHAADRAGREPQAPGRADRAQQRRTAGGGRSRRPLARRGRAHRRTGARPCSPDTNVRRCRMHSRSSSCTGCAIRIRSITPALTWLDERLAAQGTTADASCATSIRGRAPRASRCATSSPACA